jgi:hypothetical protein
MRFSPLLLLPMSGRCTEPGCPAPARIADRFMLARADGPTGPGTARCARGHWSTAVRAARRDRRRSA